MANLLANAHLGTPATDAMYLFVRTIVSEAPAASIVKGFLSAVVMPVILVTDVMYLSVRAIVSKAVAA